MIDNEQKRFSWVRENSMFRAFFSDALVRVGGTLFLASMTTNFFNYLFQITMARLLTPAEYGLMNSLFAILMIMGVPFGTILMVISKQTTEYKAKWELGKIRNLFETTYKRILTVGFVGLLIFLSISGPIKDYIHSPSVIPILILAFSIFVLLISLINIAILQGLQEFKSMSIAISLAGPLKFLFCLIMVLAGFSVSGVIGGLALGSLTVWIITYILLMKETPIGKEKENSEPINIKLTDIFSILMANLAFAVMTQVDMVLVKHFFSAYDAGIYASASVLGKAVMYLPGALVLAMFPMVAESTTLQLTSGYLIRRAMIITIFLSGSGALLLFALPGWIIRVFFGAPYLEAISVVHFFGLAMLPMALLLVQMNYFVAKGKVIFSVILTLGAIMEISLIFYFHGSLLNIISILLGVGGILSMLGFILLYFEYKLEKGRGPLMVRQKLSIKTGS